MKYEETKKFLKSPISNFEPQKGISLLFVVLIISVILSISLGISAILIQQTRMMGEVGNSVASFYAADSGIERQLYDLYKLPGQGNGQHKRDPGGQSGITFTVLAKCKKNATDCPTGFEIDEKCETSNYCVTSIGSFRATKRAIEIKY